MNLSLKSKTNELIQEKVASGRYASAEEVIEEAIRLLDDLDRELEERKTEISEGIQKGLDDIQNGRYFELTEKNQPEIEERILQRALQIMEERRRKAGLHNDCVL